MIKLLVGFVVLALAALSEPELGLGQPGLRGIESLTGVRTIFVSRLDDVGRQIADDVSRRRQQEDSRAQ